MIALILMIIGVPVVMGLLYFAMDMGKAGSVSLSIDAHPQAINATGLSKVAAQVYREYMTLPLESRPFDNIKDILISLDRVTAHFGSKARDDHFDYNARIRERSAHSFYYEPHQYPFKFSWTTGYCSHSHDPKVTSDCKYKDYYALHVEIERVKKALAGKALALVQSENAHNVSMAAELVKALRDEAGIQDKVTEQLRSKS